MIKKQSAQEVEHRENMRGGNGAVTIRHYFKMHEMKAPCRLCAELRVPPKASVGLHQHNGEDEVYIIHQGTGRIIDGAEVREVTAGDAILTGNGATHAVENIGQDDLVLTAVIITYPH